jgi:hypothetical protein
MWAVCVLGLVGCGGSPTPVSPFPGGIDCEACSDQELCWFTYDEEGAVSGGGCLDLPADCEDDRTCDCVNASQESVCDQAGWIQNGDACQTIEGQPVLECISTLG